MGILGTLILDGRPTFHAKFGLGEIVTSTFWTAMLKWNAAFNTELGFIGVLKTTALADHTHNLLPLT
jgi:hypothetical protein